MNETNEEYNGWANYNTWNVALWIGNDEALYNMAMEFVRPRAAPTYRGFVAYFDLDSLETPDGVQWTANDLDHDELNTMLAELSD